MYSTRVRVYVYLYHIYIYYIYIYIQTHGMFKLVMFVSGDLQGDSNEIYEVKAWP